MDSTKFTLDDIRRHPKFPFADWKQDDVSFLMLELYWAELARAILGDEMSNYTALFDTQRDGNPILDITNQTTRRGLRLIMIENEENWPQYPAQTGKDTFYALHPFLNNSFLPDGTTPVVELGMFLALDERYLSYFEYFVRLHCCDYAPMEKTEQAFVEYEKKFEMADNTAYLFDDE